MLPRMGARRSAWLGCALVSLVAACTEGFVPEDENVAVAEQSIVGGTADTVNQAVVAWIHGSKCSATIIAHDATGGVGYALTAGHCAGGPLGEIRQGNNHNSPDHVYTVLDVDVHPGYASSDAFDVAVVTFDDENQSPPVLPVATKAQDNIGQGSTVEAVGYGITPSNNATRRHVNLTSNYDSPMLIGYNQSSSGICSGDSGGPSLSSGRVVGVHSFTTDTECTGTGVQGFDIRASAVLDPFINPIILGSAPALHTCDECGDAHRQLGICQGDIQACLQSPQCDAYIDCVNTCSTSPCVVSCALDHAAGKAIYDDIAECVCTQACTAECAGDDYCAEPPQCFLTSSIPACQTCFEASCCDQVSACAADAFCYDCITDIAPGPSCQTNPLVSALNTCLSQNCDSQCPNGSPTGSGGGGSTGEGGMGGGPAGVGGAGADDAGAGGNPAEDDDELEVVDSGCGCRVHRRDGGAYGWLLGLGLALLWRRRRKAAPSPRG